MAKRKFVFTREELYQKYVREDRSSYDIAREYGCSAEVIQRNLKMHKIRVRTSKQAYYHRWRNHPSYRELVRKGLNKKSGTTTTQGYKMICCKKHHFTTKNHYLSEHRLMMEKHIGRYLLPQEEIHHLDQNKQNNQIENLHLFDSKAEHTKYHHMLRGFIKEALQEEN